MMQKIKSIEMFLFWELLLLLLDFIENPRGIHPGGFVWLGFRCFPISA